MHCPIVVLGGGPGGYAAAFLAADEGLEVTLVEADPRLGGSCLLRSCIPSKTLLHVARGGYIGMEMGTVYAQLGCKVSVVELLDGLLPGADRDLVKPLHKRLTGLFGERIYLNTKVGSLGLRDNKVEVAFEGPGKFGAEQFDRVLVSVGRRPNSRGFGLENTQVEIDAKGFVKVDEQQRTADPHILAIGDVAGEPMLAHKATHEGRVAAEVLAGKSVVFKP